MNIKGKRITIRAIEPGDLSALHTWLNTPEIAGALGDIHFPSSRQHQDKWFERIQQDEVNIRLAVQDENGVFIGYTGFWHLNWRDRRAEHGIIVGDSQTQGKGYGREIILTCARYAFEEMGLHRLEAMILETNAASLKAYQACGYVVEGTMREHALRAGQRVNRVMLGLLASDYSKLMAATNYWDAGEDAK
jgi:RimJ/RimL family protein N-acetyltransferase